MKYLIIFVLNNYTFLFYNFHLKHNLCHCIIYIHKKVLNNQYYNYWVPIYIDENHYKKNRTAILNSFSIIKYGSRGIKEYDFEPDQIFEI